MSAASMRCATPRAPGVRPGARDACPRPSSRCDDGDAVACAGPALRGDRRAGPHGRAHRLFARRTWTARRCCSAATRCSPAAAAACSKARRRRCMRSLSRWPRCPATPGCAAPTNTRCPTCALRWRWSRTTRDWRATRAWLRGVRATGPAHPARRRIARERQINPFLRSRRAASSAAAHARMAPASDDAVAVFAALREWKNQFR